MKIQLLSDLHVEFARYKNFKLAKEAEVLVIAGDAANFEEFKQIRKLLDGIPIPTLFVFGNHEFYPNRRALVDRYTMNEIKSMIREEMKENNNFHILDNETFQFNGVNFIGSTLWSDLEFNDHPHMPTLEVKKKEVARGIGDFRGIQDFHVDKMIQLNKESKEFIFSSLNPDMKNVVITHFPPSGKWCLDRKYMGSILNCYFMNNIPDEKFKGIDGWLFGHTHSPMIFEIEGCLFACNPRGYVDAFHVENPNFEDIIVVEI